MGGGAGGVEEQAKMSAEQRAKNAGNSVRMGKCHKCQGLSADRRTASSGKEIGCLILF